VGVVLMVVVLVVLVLMHLPDNVLQSNATRRRLDLVVWRECIANPKYSLYTGRRFPSFSFFLLISDDLTLLFFHFYGNQTTKQTIFCLIKGANDDTLRTETFLLLFFPHFC
jgi:hypothetical protein